MRDAIFLDLPPFRFHEFATFHAAYAKDMHARCNQTLGAPVAKL